MEKSVSSSLLLIPSQLCTAAAWQHQIDNLKDKMQISVANHRTSDSMPGLARSILAGAPARFAMAAHGMGGFIAFEMWRQAPERRRIHRSNACDGQGTRSSCGAVNSRR